MNTVISATNSALGNGSERHSGLILENVSKRFAGLPRQDFAAVANLNLTVQDGEFLVIVGPSGCGKTTTLRLIAGLESPDTGDLQLDGESLAGVAARNRDMAMVFGNHALLPHLTVSENLGFGLMLRKFAKDEIASRVNAAAEMLGLIPLLQSRPPVLSAGECQRVALGRALVRQPRIFLFDEPLSNLDAPMRVQLRAQIAAVHRRSGAMTVYVTHDQAEAMALADRIAVMKDGALQQVSSPLELYRRPANRFVAGFIGSPPMNFFEGTIVQRNGSAVFRGGFEAELGAGGQKLIGQGGERRVTLGLRPEGIIEGSGASFEASVERVETTGLENIIYCSGGGGSFVSRLPAERAIKSGDQLTMQINMNCAHFFDPESGAVLAG
ncbi:MAG TPA: ABC transporter ATP-binding protein [Verrucomicrobiae bacterium]|jgi:multiple sugar transport system ATP-binding protein